MTAFPQHRPVTLARQGIVAAPHYLAAEAGLELLKAGGNAIDAAIAASAALQVVYPFVCGLGGDVFMLIYDARSGELYGLNGSGRSAQMATIERYHELGYTTMPVFGIHAVTVPGCASGWDAAAQRFGRWGPGGLGDWRKPLHQLSPMLKRVSPLDQDCMLLLHL